MSKTEKPKEISNCGAVVINININCGKKCHDDNGDDNDDDDDNGDDNCDDDDDDDNGDIIISSATGGTAIIGNENEN